MLGGFILTLPDSKSDHANDGTHEKHNFKDVHKKIKWEVAEMGGC
jgi:hypothetical protein